MSTNIENELPRFGGDYAQPGYAETDRRNVIIEMRSGMGFGMAARADSAQALQADYSSLTIDADYSPVSLKASAAIEPGLGFGPPQENYCVRGTVDPEQIAEIEGRGNVVKVWNDTLIAPFVCPIPPCDCSPGIAKGTMQDVAVYLGVDKIWLEGITGKGIEVAVVDGGITADGRPVGAGETSKRIKNVIDGWPTIDWGTSAKNWGEHGNMCATDVLGMAPDARILDIRISGVPGTPEGVGGVISNAIAGFDWCINRHFNGGVPLIINNSWGIFQKSWDPDYATNRAHPFTRKVEEAMNNGIVVLFAAGNCGNTCPDGRCSADVGIGNSIWGANGHPDVMTVGAVNKNEQLAGYSSQGPAALHPDKPDFCSITHFAGYFGSDAGTSAATPIAAGVAALLKQKNTSASHFHIKDVLTKTAKLIGPGPRNNHAGSGIIQGLAAFNAV